MFQSQRPIGGPARASWGSTPLLCNGPNIIIGQGSIPPFTWHWPYTHISKCFYIVRTTHGNVCNATMCCRGSH